MGKQISFLSEFLHCCSTVPLFSSVKRLGWFSRRESGSITGIEFYNFPLGLLGRDFGPA